MTPGARVAAAIDILDEIQEGRAAEQVLTRWGRQNRYAGSKDRAAIRDYVFDVLRKRETASFLGRGATGRALMMGLLRAQGVDPEAFFTGEGHAPTKLTDAERENRRASETCADLWNLPDWLIPEIERSLGQKAFSTAQALQERAPITLRVNIARTTKQSVAAQLLSEGVETIENTLCDTALTVRAGARLLRQAPSYLEGLVELQDASSQSVVAALPPAKRCLDYCTGGGGKALAIAAQPDREVFASDIEANRMKDLAARSKRAGCNVSQVAHDQLGKQAPFDMVLCDSPCSGSGTWRRAPQAKWLFTPERLTQLCALQDEILAKAMRRIGPSGILVYATCSIFRRENEDRIARFLENHSGWSCTFELRQDVTDEGDGFYTAHLTRM